jgi:ABC-type nickel/cobalt efflux system permease component RcnA
VGGLDDAIATIGGGSVMLALIAAVLLGLRHATDPDHLTAVSTLVLSGKPGGARRASRLGLAWGAGHATTLLAFGLPVVLFERSLPDAVQRAAELAVGLIIIALAVRLLLRSRRGYLHLHPHDHDGVRHAHPHVHEHPRRRPHPAAAHGHAHRHADALGRTPLAAFGVGLVHGIGGSAGVGILLVGSISGGAAAAGALVLFAAATALSMALVSAGFGAAVSRGPAARALERLVPALATLSLLFGAWYAAAAI